MFLKRLEISGFKSFASKSVLDFDKNGNVTAVVGPNGSGKSNVADAIRWVLGEQSYKTIRSKKSEDVIFSGSNAKSKASYAKVAMVLDNSDGKAPIDFSEVEISRSVFRDGTSEYLINGKKARLLDVAELLAKSGFGQSTYSVIGQGMVDSMLFYGPAERKVLFDEAAGVRQYEIKREITLKKLEDTSSNIIRIKDILSELNPRLSALKRQAEKAKEKDTIKLSLLEKQKIYFASIWDRLSHQEKEKRQDVEKIIAEETKLQQEIAELNKGFTEYLSAEKKEGDQTEKLETEIAELEDKKDVLKQEIYTIRARIEVMFAGALSKKDIEEKIKEAQSELTKISNDAEKEKEKLEKELAEGDIEKIREEIAGLEKKKDDLKQEIFSARARIEVASAGDALSQKEIEAKIKELEWELNELRVSELEAKVAQIQKEIEKTEGSEEKLQKKIEIKKQELTALSEELSGFDFGIVGKELSGILDSQNVFLIKIQSAQTPEEIKESIDLGRKVSKSLENLAEKVGGAKEGRFAGMAELQSEIEKLMAEKEEIVAEKNQQKNEEMKVSFEVSKAQNKRQEIKSEIERLKKMTPVDKKELDSIEKDIATKQNTISGINAEINKLEEKVASFASLKSQISNLNYQINVETEKRERIEAEIKKLEATKPVDESEKKELEKQIVEKESSIKDTESEITKFRNELSKQSNDFSTKGKRLNEIKDTLAAKQSLLSTYNQEISNLRVDLARVETKKGDLKEEIIRELGSEAVLADARVVPELHEEESRVEIEKLKGKLYAIGEIDPEVETEFEEVSKRVEFLSGQTGDLEKAKEDLGKLVNELDGKIKKQFEASFMAISQKFAHFFEVLFGGGTAKLELVKQKDEEEETEKFGIEISAVPPGKRVQSLSALSGGERTLTSLALLFAILSVNPAPFCVLDEVDAALDETNTKKFLKIVHELSNSTQFIFISHNRETMKEASIIYGITMDDSHASKILSIRLEDALAVKQKA